MVILGIHGGITINQHDAGAAIVKDGELICFIEEERLLRVKSPRGVLPILSITACLEEAELSIKDVDYVAFAGETYDCIDERIKEFFKHHFGYSPKIKLINHQTAHLASAFYPSGFNQAMCLSYDAYGDNLSGAMGVGDINDGISVIETIAKTNSLGMFYATITSFLGFMPGEDEYKVMGLAPYGENPIDLSDFAKPSENGYVINNDFIKTSPPPSSIYEQFYSSKLVDILGEPRRKGEPIKEHHRNIAAGAQFFLEQCITSLVTYLHKKTGLKNLSLAGGVALNCSANRIITKLPFIDKLFIQPAASDRGLPLGCALQATKELGTKVSPPNHVFYGPSQSNEDILSAIRLTGFKAEKTNDPAETAAKLLADGKIIGWYQGRSEFGPRALGHRSILANPSSSNMKAEINAKIKYREEFRPFAPSVLEEKAHSIYILKQLSPYMTVAVDVKKEWGAKTPATTHVNGTARVQTVDSTSNFLYHSLITNFEKKTGIPLVLNTSFNIKGQPIVEDPIDAISTFAGTGLDSLIIGSHLINKENSPRMRHS